MERQGLHPGKRVAYFEYDFSRDGGSIGDITLRGDALPNEALVDIGKIHIKTACTSGGSATIALKVVGTADVLAATAVASFSAGAVLNTVPVATAATSIKVAASGLKVVATVAVAALTAGRFIVALEYY